MIVTTTLALLLNAPSALAVTTEYTLINEVKGKSSSSSSKKKKKSSSSSSSSSSSKSSSKSRPDDDDKSSKETKKRPDDGGGSQDEGSSKGQNGGDDSRGGQGSKSNDKRGGARGNDKKRGSDSKKNQNDNKKAKAKAKAKAKTKAKHNKAKNQKAGHKSKHHYKKVHRYHGVFVWGPRPGHHRHYSGGNSSVSNSHMPVRSVNRGNTLALGLRMGSLHSGYNNAEGYGDPGLGFMARYRPVEALGFELTHQEYGVDSADSYRLQTLTQASIEVFVVPWSRFSPYVLMGVTTNDRNIDDPINNGETIVQADRTLHGLHVGIGAEFAIGSRFAFDLESRFVQYGDKPDGDPSAAGAIQTTGSLIYHF
jgi:opacity protein-like surface antigen